MSTFSALYITSRGFSEHEQEVLSRQLKVVTAKAGSCWTYAQSEKDGDPILVLDKQSGSERIDAVFSFGSDRVRLSSLVAPLRMFNLLEVLQLCESRMPKRVSTIGMASLALRLGKITGVARLALGSGCTWVDVATDTLWSPWELTEEVAHQLRSQGQNLEVVDESELGDTSGLFLHSFKATLWSLALRERDREIGHRNWAEPGLQFRIGAWPLLSEWQSSPAMLRLCALYSRQYANLEQGMDFARATESNVIAFLHACECCGLSLFTRSAPQAVAPIKPVTASVSLLQRLRQSLGLSFKRS